MVSKKICVGIHNFLGSILGWAAYSLGISSITNIWFYRGPYTMTLWRVCSIGNNICSSPAGEPWLNATRAFLILFIIFTFFAQMVNISSQCKYNKKTRSSSGSMFTIAATFGVIGAVVATATISQTSSYEWGIGQIFAWTAVGLGYLAGMFNSISAYYMEESSETCAIGKTGNIQEP